jgi:hypothetical protein
MFCQNCGAFDTDDAKFCSRCGESLSETPEKEGFLLHRMRKWESFRECSRSLRSLFDSRQPVLRIMRALCGLFILSAALLAALIVVTGSGTSLKLGLIMLLMIGSLAFLFMVMCGRVILELDSVLSRMGKPRIPVTANPEPEDQKDPIEWHIG